MKQIRLHIMPLTNQEKEASGTFLKSYKVTLKKFSELIDRINVHYPTADIKFLFDPAFDWAPMANREINRVGGRLEYRQMISSKIRR